MNQKNSFHLYDSWFAVRQANRDMAHHDIPFYGSSVTRADDFM